MIERFNINRERSTHGARLERWLGAATVEELSKSMKDWHGPPIAVAGVPGNVWAHQGGDFHGIIRSGQFLSAVDFAVMRLKRILQNYGQRQRQYCGIGFASLSDLRADATAGKRRDIYFSKTPAAGGLNVNFSYWADGAVPPAGAAGSAAPGGRAPNGSTVGAQFGLDNVSSDTRHFAGAVVSGSQPANLLLYDRIFDVAKTMNSTATEAVTGVPTRYQSTTASAEDYAGGNFVFVETFTSLAVAAHNWTVCTYTDQAGGASTLPSITGSSGQTIGRIDHPVGRWFAPLANDDVGVKALTQMQCSALIATGAINFVIGHAIAWLPIRLANVACTLDGINTAFNLVRIFDDAALAFLDTNRPNASNPSSNGMIKLIHG